LLTGRRVGAADLLHGRIGHPLLLSPVGKRGRYLLRSPTGRLSDLSQSDNRSQTWRTMIDGETTKSATATAMMSGAGVIATRAMAAAPLTRQHVPAEFDRLYVAQAP
jgi:hypothetical protein